MKSDYFYTPKLHSKGGSPMTLRPLPKQNEINRLNKALTEFYHDLCVQAGMSNSVFDIFYAFTSKQTIHSAIHKLEKEGFLRFQSGKGREQLIFLTPVGEQFMKEKIVPVIAMENDVISQMPPDETDQLLRLTARYLDCLRSQPSPFTAVQKKK